MRHAGPADRIAHGLSWWTTYFLTPFRLDGLALGAFLAVTARQPGGLDRLVRALPWSLPWPAGCWWSPSSGPAWSRARGWSWCCRSGRR